MGGVLMKITIEQFDVVKKWMYRNARPLDIARWKYHFESGSKEDVLTALSAYQNPDGGFGYALEADSWNPNSSPIQTWCATEVLNELNILSKDNPIIKGILSYLDSGKDFKDGYWYAEIPSNNDYPHAPWWSFDENVIGEWGYNPTICLVGFILYFSERHSHLYEKAKQIAVRAVGEFLKKEHLKDMHELLCFIRLWEYCERAQLTDLVDMDGLRQRIIENVREAITKNIQEWKTSYVCKPSQFLLSPNSIFYVDNKEIAHDEVDYIIKSLNYDGSWNVNWSWHSYPEEWAISKNWWKANQTIINLRYLQGFGCI
jgi:hypothetical protein